MHSERYFFAVQLPIVQARNTAFGLTKLAAAACMQCTAQRQQKTANTSLLESRNLLQTATVVFTQPIVCSRLRSNIYILAKKVVRTPTEGPCPPAPGWIRHWMDALFSISTNGFDVVNVMLNEQSAQLIGVYETNKLLLCFISRMFRALRLTKVPDFSRHDLTIIFMVSRKASHLQDYCE